MIFNAYQTHRHSKLDEATTLLSFILEVSVPNTCWGTSYPERYSSWVSTFPKGKWLDSNFN
jgi:hypothetical protein